MYITYINWIFHHKILCFIQGVTGPHRQNDRDDRPCREDHFLWRNMYSQTCRSWVMRMYQGARPTHWNQPVRCLSVPSAPRFFLWGHVKSMVYVTSVATRAQLMDRLNSAFDDVKQNPALLSRVGRSLLRRYQTCNEAQGRLFEHVLQKHAFFNKMICTIVCIQFRPLRANTFTCA